MVGGLVAFSDGVESNSQSYKKLRGMLPRTVNRGALSLGKQVTGAFQHTLVMFLQHRYFETHVRKTLTFRHTKECMS